MNKQAKLSGRCLCGAVSVKADSEAHDVGACHCRMCRRWTGGPYMVVDCKGAVSFTGEDKIKRYRSSAWAERGFCGECGTILFYRLVEPDHYVLSAGMLDDQESLELTSQIFVDEKPAFYDFANKTKMMTGAEVIEMFAPKA